MRVRRILLHPDICTLCIIALKPPPLNSKIQVFFPPPSLSPLDKTASFHLASLFCIILISARPANPLCHCIIHGAPLTKFPFMWAMCPETKILGNLDKPDWLIPDGDAQLCSGKPSSLSHGIRSGASGSTSPAVRKQVTLKRVRAT